MDRFKRTKVQYQLREMKRLLDIAKHAILKGDAEGATKAYERAHLLYKESEREVQT